MNTIEIESVQGKKSTEICYLLINKAAEAIAVINPIPLIFSRLEEYIFSQNYHLDWVLLTHLPKDNSTLLKLQSQFCCVIASSLTIIQQLPKSLISHCEAIENHEVVMLGHLALEVGVAGNEVNYQIDDHLFVYNEKSIELHFLEKLQRKQNNILIHLVNLNTHNPKLSYNVSPREFKSLVNSTKTPNINS